MTNYFSVSDVMTFLACRNKWDISSPNRRSLRHKATPRFYLSQGTALHVAIDAQARGIHGETYGDPVQAAVDYLAEERKARVAAYKAETGFEPWPQEMAEFDEKAAFTIDLTRQYFEHYGYVNPLADQGLTYLATEVPFKIDISSWVNKPDSWFVGTFDAIAVDEEDRLFLGENKTYTQKPDLWDLQTHFQTTGYAVAFQMLTGMELTGALYNGIAKKLIAKPRRLKDGSLSSDKRQQTTYSMFLAEMSRDGLASDHPKYQDILKKLKDIETQGDTRFFYREKFYFNDWQIQSWIDDFSAIVQEMSDEPRIFRTIPYNGCGPQGNDCWVRDICYAEHSGQEVQPLLDKKYEVGKYGTIEAVDGLESINVSSISDLRKALQTA